MEYKNPSAYESTQGHGNFDKVNDIKVIVKTEQILIVDDVLILLKKRNYQAGSKVTFM